MQTEQWRLKWDRAGLGVRYVLWQICVPLQALQQKYSPKIGPEIDERVEKKRLSEERLDFLWSNEEI